MEGIAVRAHRHRFAVPGEDQFIEENGDVRVMNTHDGALIGRSMGLDTGKS